MTFAKIREEFSSISVCLTRTKSKVLHKFLVEMVLGISVTSHAILANNSYIILTVTNYFN